MGVECDACTNPSTTVVAFDEPRYQTFELCDEHRAVATDAGARVLTQEAP